LKFAVSQRIGFVASHDARHSANIGEVFFMAVLAFSSKDQPIRIFLVAEENLFRAGLEKLLESWPEYEIAGKAGSREETLEMLQHVHADVVLLTLTGEDQELQVVSEIAKACAPARILVLVHNERGIASQLVTLGAGGVIAENKGPDKLRQALRTVYAGKELWLDRASLNALVNGARGNPENPESRIGALTAREREVAGLVSRGFTNKEVGERLFISETTVRHHLTTIFDKLKVRNRFELIDFLYRNHISISFKEQAAGQHG
jgi:DNA-binding NarL/FixJ family response regulator